VDHRSAESGGEPDRGRVEGVVVDDVVLVLAHSRVDAGERALGRGRRTIGGAGSSIERGAQRPVVDSGVDNRNAWNLGSGRRVEVNFVTSADKPTREVGNEGL
jgi:hypothetical protein